MKSILLLLFIAFAPQLFSQKIKIKSSIHTTIPGMESGAKVTNYTYEIIAKRKNEIIEFWLLDNHIYSDKKLLLKRGNNVLTITTWVNHEYGVNDLKIRLNGVDITDICFQEPIDEYFKNATFIFKKGPKITLDKFDKSSSVAMP